MPFRHITQARALRQTATLAERRLWSALRGGRLGGWRFRRQHPIAPFIADFACPRARLVIELDGGVHEDRDLEDGQRQWEIEARGWRVIRFPNAAVLQHMDEVLEAITAAMNLGRK